MGLRDIENNLEMAKVYKYACQLELEKEKRRNNIYHDFSDIDDFYKQKVNEYDEMISRLKNQRKKLVYNYFRLSGVGINAFLISMFVLINI